MSCLLYLCCGGLLISLALAEGTKEIVAEPESGSTLNFAPKYSKLLDERELEQMKASMSVGTVFYYKEGASDWTDRFLNIFDKSAGFLNAYGLPLGVVDCSGILTKRMEDICATVNGNFVYSYSKGQILLELNMETMFDVDTIMANILLLALVDEVSIVQNKSSRDELEHENAGQREVVLGYHSSIGTFENRVFMEIAYAYQDKYAFAITSETAATAGLQDADQLVPNDPGNPDCMIWVLYCRERYNLGEGCRSVNYRGQVNLIDLAVFFKRLDWPRVVHKGKGKEETHPCESSTEVGCVVVSHSPSAREEADKIIDSLQFDIHGMVGLIVEHVDDGPGGSKVLKIVLQKPDGESMTLDESLELDKIEEEIATHLLPVSQSKAEEPIEHDFDPTNIDDMVVHMAYLERQHLADVPLLPALTDKTFPATTKDNKLAMVLFYLPFDAEGMLFLKIFEDAGKKIAAMKGDDPTAHPLARVNCFDWTDVCRKENITTYPALYIYRKGVKRDLYRLNLNADAVVRTVMLLQAEQPLMLTSEKEVNQFLNGQLPTEAYKGVDNLVLLKLSKSRKETEMYIDVVKALEAQMLFAVVAPDVTDLIPNGGVLHKRPKDSIQPMETLTAPRDAATIIEFLLKRQFALFPELTFMNFPTLYARKQPFAILFYEPSVPSANDMHQTIVSLLLSEKVHDMVFCKMTVGDSNLEAKTLLMNYTQTETVPAFTIVNHQKGQVYVLQDKDMKGSALLPWIQAVQKGEVAPTKILEKGEWKEPGQHYDFLALMDKEKETAGKKGASEAVAATAREDTVEEQQDVETRNALLELQQSRLYSGKDRKMHKEAADTVTATVKPKTAADMGKGRKSPKHSEL